MAAVTPYGGIAEGLERAVTNYYKAQDYRRRTAQDDEDRARTLKLDERADEQYAYDKSQRSVREQGINLGLDNAKMQNEESKMSLENKRKLLNNENYFEALRMAENRDYDGAVKAYNSTGKSRIKSVQHHPDDPQQKLLIAEDEEGNRYVIDPDNVKKALGYKPATTTLKEGELLLDEKYNVLAENKKDFSNSTTDKAGIYSLANGRPISHNQLKDAYNTEHNFPSDEELLMMDPAAAEQIQARKATAKPFSKWVKDSYGIDLQGGFKQPVKAHKKDDAIKYLRDNQSSPEFDAIKKEFEEAYGEKADKYLPKKKSATSQEEKKPAKKETKQKQSTPKQGLSNVTGSNNQSSGDLMKKNWIDPMLNVLARNGLLAADDPLYPSSSKGK